MIEWRVKGVHVTTASLGTTAWLAILYNPDTKTWQPLGGLKSDAVQVRETPCSPEEAKGLATDALRQKVATIVEELGGTVCWDGDSA